MNRWEHLYFFDKNGKYYNFEYDSANDMWTGDIYLPEVSVGLFEVGQLFILQKFIDTTTNTFKFGFPHSYVEGTTGITGATGGCDWLVSWETTDPSDILLFQFDLDYDTGTQTSLEIENAGPPIEKYDTIDIPLEYDPTQTVDGNGYVNTSDITSEAIQINFAINSEEENTFKRTLIIEDECTGTTVAKFVIYAETIGEDERLRVMTNNLGYNIALSDSSIFRDTNIYEQFPDFIEINRKRKEIMLEGHNIYPFIGSYKGLINAINYFGYNNLQVKEFWRNVNSSSPNYGKYIQSSPIKIFDPTVSYNDLSITLPNKNFRKTNLFSLVYKINQVVDGKYDIEDLPITEEVFDYTIEEVLIKLFGLKNKLEKEFLPLNARIKDITGEADFFGLLEVTNTLSRNDKRNISAGIAADFKVSPEGCNYLEDLRTFASFCLQEEAEVGEAIINFCNAYIAPLMNGGTGSSGASKRNLLLGPYNDGDPLPPPPIGPDVNNILGSPYGGQNLTVNDIADVYLAYFTRYAPNLKNIGDVEDGWSSLYLPDKPGIPVGALTVLENTSFNNLTWNNIDVTWDQISNANRFHTYDLDPQGAIPGDIYKIFDPVSETEAVYTVQAGDTDTDIRDQLYNQLVSLRTSFVDPWIFWDISKENLPTEGDVIRIFGDGTERIELSVTTSLGALFRKIDYPGELLYTWDSIQRGNFSEIEWTIYKDKTDVSPAFYYNIRGPIAGYNRLPITLPYVGNYSVEMRLYDLYNNISSLVKTDEICIDAKEVEYSGWYQARKAEYTWNGEGKWKWNDYGSMWNLPIEPSVKWNEETPSLYESLDRVNAILNTFGLGVSPNFQLLNYQDDGKASFMGPYFWNNITEGTWSDSYHLWWDVTAVTGDTPAFFQFKEIQPDSYLKIIDKKGNVGEHYFSPTTTTLAQAASQLNLSTNPIINKYVYNVVYDASNNQKFIQAVARYFGNYGDWTFVDIVDVDGNRICASTGSTGSTGTGCESLIYRSGLHKSSNPTWSTGKFINDGMTLPKLTWIMFVYDKCKISGKGKPRWIIKNTTARNRSDIYFESKYLTYLFQDPGKYEITLELTDSNGNKYKKGRNILIIK